MKTEKKLTKKMEQMFNEDLRFTKGASHCHSENSMDDAVSTVEEICNVAAENGAAAAFISDHGTAMGWDDFDMAAQKSGVKPIFGVEAYYLDDVTQMKSHLILYAMNQDGLKKIQRAMARGVILDTKGKSTDAEDNGFTCLTDESLEYLKGGDIIASSACIGGVLGSVVVYDDRIKQRINKIEKEIADLCDVTTAYDEAIRLHEECNQKWSVLKAEVSEAKAASKKSFSGKQKQLDGMLKKVQKAQAAFEKFLVDGKESSAKSVKVALAQLEVNVEDSDDFQNGIEEAQMKYNQRAAQLKSETERTKAIADTLQSKTIEMDKAKELKDVAKERLATLAKEHSKIEKRREKIAELSNQRLSKNKSVELVQKRLDKMLEVFGSNFYMEVQNHGLELEAKIYPWLAKMAKKNRIPLIAANDAHMASNSETDKIRRQIRRSCRFKKWEMIEDDFKEYYIKNDKELALALYQILPEDMVIESMVNVAKVVDLCNASIERGSHAPKAKVENVKDEIVRIARENIGAKYGSQWGEKHEKRFEYEINTIDSMGFNDYFYIVWDILNFARNLGGLSYEKLDELTKIIDDMTLNELLSFVEKFDTEPNLSVGLGRGSGAGSIVCYLLGITNIDPFKYDLLFERFLNPERVSMPDIDSDLRSDIKDIVPVYLKKKYGDRAIAKILTKSFLQGKSAIDKVAMILGSRDGLDYRYIADRLKKKTGVDFSKSMLENKDALMRGVESEIEKEIVETSIAMDNNLDHTGLHAAGLIISDNEDLSEYIPVAWDTGKEMWKTQCDMVQCESKHGLLKMDLLLLTTLDIVTYTLRLIKKNHPNDVIDIENLPFEEDVFKNVYAAGKTKAVFQFESSGMVQFLRQLQPTCIEDIIAANALYRPGPMDYIPEYVNSKHSGNVVYDCPELEPILKETYGVIVYQEQVQRIVRDLAGYSLGRADLVRRAMAKKHEDELLAERKNFIYGNADAGIHGCVAIGIKEDVANKIFDKMIAFASYAFNKSHAAVYSVTSYMTAWLKYHYPTEFFCAALNFVDAQKEIPSIIADAKRHGVNVLRPDINKSEANFTTENGNIRFGLKFLANANTRAASVVENREGGYRTFTAFVQSKPGKQMAEACILSGACDAYINNNPDQRSSLLTSYYELDGIYDSIQSAQSRIEAATKDDARKTAQTAYDEALKKWNEYKLAETQAKSLLDRLKDEQKYTSVYFSGNPLDAYEIDYSKYKELLSMEDQEEGWVVAVMSDEKELKTKKDALPMMSMTLSDLSGNVGGIIFPKAFSTVSDKLQTVMAFKGKMSAPADEDPQFIVSDVKVLPEKTRRMIVWFNNFESTKELIKAGRTTAHGSMEVWMVGKNSKMYATGCRLTEEYANAYGLKYTIM